MLSRLRNACRVLWRRDQMADEVREELAAHVAMRQAELEQRGLNAADAEKAARRAFGNLSTIQSEAFAERAGRLDEWAQDIRYAWRVVWKTPRLTIVAALTLALGIGVNGTLFSVVNGFFLRPIPGVDLTSVMQLTVDGTSDRSTTLFRPGLTHAQRAAIDTLELSSLEATFTSDVVVAAVAANGQTELASGEVVSGRYFSALRLQPSEGRLLSPEDDVDATAGTSIVISRRLARRLFPEGGTAVGKAAAVAGHSVTIVGVAPEDFNGTWLPTMMSVDIWVPAAVADRVRTIQGVPRNGRTFARLAPGITASQANAQVASVDGGTIFGVNDARLRLAPSERAMVFDAYRRPGLAIGTAVLALSMLVLLGACANLTNLFLARASTRVTEIATRLALGGGPRRMFRLVFFESAIVAALAGAGGLALTWVTAVALARFPLPAFDGVRILLEFTPDWQVVGFLTLVALVAAVGTGTIPSLAAARTEPARVCAVGSLTTSTPRRSLLTTCLVVSQIALAVVLLVLSSLFTRAERSVGGIDVDLSHTVVAQLDMRYHRATEDDGREVIGRAVSAATAVGVFENVATRTGTFDTLMGSSSALIREGQAPGTFDRTCLANRAGVSDSFAPTLGLSLQDGRHFDARDVAGAPRVALIDQRLAATCWSGRAIGQRFRFRFDGPLIEIVGVLTERQTRSSTLPFDRPSVYLPAAQEYSPIVTIVAATRREPDTVVHALRDALRQAIGDRALIEVTAGPELRSVGEVLTGVGSAICTALALVGLFIAILGVHGVIAHSIAQRTREIGIRSALGATARDIRWDVVKQGLRLATVGLVVGLPLAYIAARLLRRFLFGLAPHDPVTYGVAASIVVAVVLATAVLASRRAVRLDPVAALTQAQ